MNFTSKLSLYDIVAMVVPGWSTLFVLQGFLSRSSSIDKAMDFILTGDGWPIGLALSYIIGLGVHSLSNLIWSGFRNNPIRLQTQLGKVRSEVGNTWYLDRLYDRKAPMRIEERRNCSDYIKSAYWFLTCLWVIYSILFVGYNYLTSHEGTNVIFLYINVCFVVVFYIILASKVCFNTSTQEQKILNAYYKAYYYVQQRSKKCNVSTIEGQVAFLQSMFIPLSLWLCLPNKNWFDFYTKDLLLLVCALTYPLVIRRIDKIHYLVWCDYEFLKEIEK